MKPNFRKAVKRNKVVGKMFGRTFSTLNVSLEPKKVYWCEEVCAGCDKMTICYVDSTLCYDCIKKGEGKDTPS